MSHLSGEQKVEDLYELWTAEHEGPGENDLSIAQMHWWRGYWNAVFKEYDVDVGRRNRVPARTEIHEWKEQYQDALTEAIEKAQADSNLVVFHPVFH